MKHLPPLKLSLALLACASFQHPLHAAVIAFEGFDYAEANYNSASTLPTTAPDVAMSTVTSATGTLNSAFSGRAFSNSAPIGIDEIRIGTAFSDVMSIPEPSAALLGLFGLLGLVRRRR